MNHPQGSNSDGKLFGLLLQAHRSLGLGDDVSGSVVEKSAFMENIWKKNRRSSVTHTIHKHTFQRELG